MTHQQAAAVADEAATRVRVRTLVDESLRRGAFVPRCDAWLTGWSPEFSRLLGGAGLLGLTIPVAYGGHGQSALLRYVVVEELLAAGAPVAAHWFADRQFAPSLLSFGSDAQKERYLPLVSAGELYVALGLSEADAGSDLAAVRTSAVQVPGGWLLTGAKLWSSGAHGADLIVVLARTSPADEGRRHAGLSQFIVDLPDERVTVNPIRLMTGEHHFNEVVFDRVFVPDHQVLGAVGTGWTQITAELAYERSGPERYLTVMPLIEALASRMASHPDPFLRREVGRITARAFSLRALSLGVARQLAAGRAPETDAAIVKDLGTTFEQDVADVLLSVAGIDGDLASDDPLEVLLAEAVLHSPGYSIRGGTNEVLRGIVARSLGLR